MNKIRKKIFFLKNLLFRKYAIKEYQIALERERFSESNIQDINWSKRKKIVNFAYKNNSFYNRFYKRSNFHPDQLIKVKDWNQVPILEKEHIRAYKDQILDSKISKDKLIRVTTGGSTGEPLELFRDKRFPEEIIKWRMLKRWNLHPGANKAMVWRQLSFEKSLYHKLKNFSIWYPTLRYKYDVSDLSKDKLEKIAKSITFKKPPIIWGYVGAIEQLALFMLEYDISLKYNPVVWVTAAPVSQIQKNLFLKVFSRYVLDQYACSEVHWVAANTPFTENLLVEDDYRHVDIADSAGNLLGLEQEGDILLTDLENRAFPLIKYRVGDRTRKIKNTLPGNPFSMLAPVKGRNTDLIKSPNGILLSGEFLTTIFDDYTDTVKQFQVVQKADYSINVLVVLHSGVVNDQSDRVLGNVRSLLQKKLDGEVPVEVNHVKSLPHDRGKIRFVKSELM